MSTIKVACVSDIHLGNRSNPTVNIIANLDNAFPDDEETGELDIIFLAGDVFDRLLNLPEEFIVEIDLWICRLLRICKRHDIMLRVLDGTKSHDWYQSARFTELNALTKTNANVQYVKDLTIEHIDRFGIDILYIPDEWSSSTADTLQQVKSLLAVKGLSHVDLGIFHGQMDFQMPAHIKKIPIHSSAEYLKIVKHYTFIGHVHIHSYFERIIAQGSFDRLSHGEESPKGHVRAEINLDTDERQWFFIENKGARIYKTIRCEDELNLEDSLAKIRAALTNVPDFSAVRVYANKGHPVLENKPELIKIAPMMTWTMLAKDVVVEEIVMAQDHVESSITISKDNIVSLLLARIEGNAQSVAFVDKCRDLLKEVI